MFIDIQQNKAPLLSAEERAVFFEVVEPTLRINDQEQFFGWTKTQLQRVFPHDMLVCGIGRIGKHGVQVQRVIGCNFPQKYLQTLQRPDGLTNSPILAKWMKEQQPVLFEPDASLAASGTQSEWLNNFRRFGLLNLAAHGQCDVDSQTASYFSFSRIPDRLSARHADLLQLLVPHLHVALARVVSNQPAQTRKSAPQPALLTARERETLEWLSSGKTNWEISQVMGISASTVKNHVHHILTKLHASTRAQASAKAINLKLIRAKQRHRNQPDSA